MVSGVIEPKQQITRKALMKTIENQVYSLVSLREVWYVKLA